MTASQDMPPQPASPVDDIFARTDNPYSHPHPGHMPPGGMSRQAPPMKIKGDYAGRGHAAVFIIPILIVVVIGLIITASWLAFNSIYKSGSNQPASSGSSVLDNLVNSGGQPAQSSQQPSGQAVPTSTTDVQSALVNPDGQSNTNVVQQASSSATTSSTVVSSNPNADTDGDGLKDIEEEGFGTNPLKGDTDGDGLSDYAEVKIYSSNPINPDTDGDGYQDGSEVVNGFDPNKGDGAKLFN